MDAANYYEAIKTKWATEYPSCQSIDEVWEFYRECGYEDPQASYRRMLSQIEWKRGRLLDFGCDNGLMLAYMCGLNPGLQGYGVDINEAAIRDAQSRFPDLKFSSFGGVTLPFDDNYFDLVFMSAVLKHIRYEDRSAVYEELRRVSDGLLVIEKDSRKKAEVTHGSWTFYESNFEEELAANFERLHMNKEGGDIWGLYRL